MLGLLFACCLFPLLAACDEDNSGQLYDVGEANTILLASFAAKNSECGSTVGLTTPVGARVDRDHLDACVAAVMATSCATWTGDSPTPAACLSMGVSVWL